MLNLRPLYCPDVIVFDSCDQKVFPINDIKPIIDLLSQKSKVISVYINHKFDLIDESQIVVKTPEYSIYKETKPGFGDITSALLRAGSSYVYYIKTEVDSYRAAFVHFYDILSGDYPILCLSLNLAFQLQAAAIVLPESTSQQKKDEIIAGQLHQSPILISSEILKYNLSFKDRKILLNG